MKKLFKTTLALLVAASIGILCPITSSAASLNQGTDRFVLVKEDVEYLGDNLYLVTTINEQIEPSVTPFSSTYTKTGSKIQTVKNSSNVTLFSYTVHGTFTVNPGVSATCTSSTASYSISDSVWSLDSSTTSKSGNKAMGTGVFKKRLLLIVVDTMPLNITLSCNSSGVLS